jgi:hypothetical protein
MLSKLLMASVSVQGPPSLKWNTTLSNSSMTFSDNNRTATNGGNLYQTAFADLPTNSGGKYYWEVTETISNNFGNIGVGTSTQNDIFYQDASGSWYVQRSSNTSFESSGWTGQAGSVNTYNDSSRNYGFAYDVDSRKLWVRQDGGSWVGGGNPASGTTPSVTLSGTAYLVGNTYQTNTQSFTIKDKSSQTYNPPSGFDAIGGDA